MAVRFIPVSICRVPATINGKHFLEPSDDEIIAAINKQLSGHCEFRIERLNVEQFVVADINKTDALLRDMERAIHPPRAKSPRQLARAAARVQRMTDKAKTKRATWRKP